MSTAESLWHTIPRGRDKTGQLQLSAAVTPVSTAADPDHPQPTPQIWHKWPNSVAGLRYRLQYRDAGGLWNTNAAELVLVSKPNERLWEKLFPEIGVRMTCGATARDVLWLVLRQSLALIFVGVGIGTFAALAAGRLLQRLIRIRETVENLNGN